MVTFQLPIGCIPNLLLLLLLLLLLHNVFACTGFPVLLAFVQRLCQLYACMSSSIGSSLVSAAVSLLQVPLPESPPWWELFGVQPELMYTVCHLMHDLYARPRAEYIPVCRQLYPSKPTTPATPATQYTAGQDESADQGKRPNGSVQGPGADSTAASAGEPEQHDAERNGTTNVPEASPQPSAGPQVRHHRPSCGRQFAACNHTLPIVSIIQSAQTQATCCGHPCV